MDERAFLKSMANALTLLLGSVTSSTDTESLHVRVLLNLLAHVLQNEVVSFDKEYSFKSLEM